MTEAVHPLYETDLSDNDIEDDELSTAHLSTGHLALLNERVEGDVAEPTHRETEGAPEANTDWLALLTRRPTQTEPLMDEPPPPIPQPTGMAEHGTAPVIRPTLWSRLTSGAGRVWRIALVSSLIVLLVAGAAYLLVREEGRGMRDEVNRSGSSVSPPPAAPSSSEGSSGSGPATSSGGAPTGTLAEQGAALYQAGDYDGAIGILEASVLEEGGDPVTYYQLGLAYLAASGRKNAQDDAELALRTAISMQPDWAPPYRLLAETLIRRGFHREAIDFATRATELNAADAQTWVTLGRAYEGAGRAADATRAYAEAERLAPQP